MIFVIFRFPRPHSEPHNGYIASDQDATYIRHMSTPSVPAHFQQRLFKQEFHDRRFEMSHHGGPHSYPSPSLHIKQEPRDHGYENGGKV